jgi:hypothetical protein
MLQSGKACQGDNMAHVMILFLVSAFSESLEKRNSTRTVSRKLWTLMSIHLIPIYISSVVCDYHLHIFITTSIEIPIMEWPCWIISIMIMWQVYCEPFGKQCLLFNGIDNLDHTWILALWKHYLYASLEIHVFYNYCSSSLSDAWSYTSIQFIDSV